MLVVVKVLLMPGTALERLSMLDHNMRIFDFLETAVLWYRFYGSAVDICATHLTTAASSPATRRPSSHRYSLRREGSCSGRACCRTPLMSRHPSYGFRPILQRV